MTSGQPMSATVERREAEQRRGARGPSRPRPTKCQVNANSDHRRSDGRSRAPMTPPSRTGTRSPRDRGRRRSRLMPLDRFAGLLDPFRASDPRSGRVAQAAGRSASGGGTTAASAASGPCSSSTREAGGVEDRAARAPRPCRPSSPGFSPTTTKSVFFDTEPLTLPPGLLHRERGAVARPALDRAGDHDGDAVERAGAGVEPLLGHAYAGLAPLLARPRGASRRRTTRRRPSAMIGPTPSTADELLDARGGDAVEVAELAGQRLGGGGADVADRQRHDHPPQRPGLRGLELAEQLLGVGREHPAARPRRRG